MKKMNYKLFITVIALTLVIAACGKKDDKATNESKKTEDTVLKVGMDLSYPPFETVDNDNNPMGISVDIAEELGKYLGVKVEIVNTPFASLIPALDSDAIDVIIGSMSITEERRQKVDFSDPYNYFKIIGLANNEYLKNNKYDKGVKFDEIFENKDTRFVGLTSQVSARIPSEKGFKVIESTQLSTAILEVVQNNADILLMSPDLIVNANNSNPDTTTVLWSPASVSPIGAAVKKGNTELLNKVNKFIVQMESSGFNDKMREKYSKEVNSSLGITEGYDYYLNEK